jgi:hypothetical protein
MDIVLGPNATQPELWEQLAAYRDALGARTGTDADAWLSEVPLPTVDGSCQPTARTLSEVAYEHGITQAALIARLTGRLCLDVGGGFSRINESLPEGAGHVVTLDTPATFKKGEIRGGVIGLAQHMPFKDSAFDTILATFSLPSHATSPLDIKMFIDESFRVLKTEGSLLISPLTVHDTYTNQKRRTWYYFLDTLLELANNSDHETVLKVGIDPPPAFRLPEAVEITVHKEK